MSAFRDSLNALPAIPLPENFCLKRSEIFGPNSEKHFRMDARQQGDLRLGQIYRLDAVEQVAVLGFLGWRRRRAV